MRVQRLFISVLFNEVGELHRSRAMRARPLYFPRKFPRYINLREFISLQT